MVGQNGLEPSTSRLSVVCSSQLSYWPVFSSLLPALPHPLLPDGDSRDRFSAEKPRRLQHAAGMLPMPPFDPVVTKSLGWWRLAGSNRWPPACKAGALPAELNPRISFVYWILNNEWWIMNNSSIILHYSFFIFHSSFFVEVGGPKWTRTIDLTIISRVL